MLKQVITVLIFFGFVQLMRGQYTAILSGNFNDPATWQGGNVPPNPVDNDLTINAGVVVIMIESLSVIENSNHLVIINGELNDGGNGYSLTIGKKTNLNVDGTLNIHTLNLLEYSGTNRPIASFSANANITLATLNSGAIINNAGSLTVTEGINQTNGEINNTGSIASENFTNNGNFNNNGSGTVTVSSKLTNTGNISNNAPQANFVTSILVNTGTIDGNGIIVTTLPIKLKYFTAKLDEGFVMLEFRVEDIFGAESYHIEHSADGQNYQPLFESEVEKIGSFNEDHYFTHFAPETGHNYYALYVVDDEGQKSLLKIASIDFSTQLTPEFKLTAKKNQLKIEFFEPGKRRVEIYAMSGRLVHRSEILDMESFIDTQQLYSGIYVIRVESGKRTEARKVFLY